MSFLARSFVRRAAIAARPMIARRGFAEAVPADKLRLSLALPYETLYQNSDVYLRPGLVEVIESSGSSKQFFVSGGFATVSEGSNLAINVVEAFAPEDFSAEAVKTLLAEAQKNAASSDAVVAAEAAIEVEVLESLSHIAK
ncbi:hypothetical protein D0Z00_003686 [Geotrichum galactomycetum]|uniref:Uncharacterized protein n=1 Tax=Geotrichum galactomycetum TaxID=27317 RepID=A0ACB6V0U9_9ASCO|nr:hypothetical protein D0Z00_003686 [Geotrichum candidum]